MHKRSEREPVITANAGGSPAIRLWNRFNTVNRPKPTTPHCNAWGFSVHAPKFNGGRGESALVIHVNIVIATAMTPNTSKFTHQSRVDAFRLASDHQLAIGATERSTARLV